MESQSIDLSLSCDDAYLSLLLDLDHEPDRQNDLVSDLGYASELQLQEAIMSSLLHLVTPKPEPEHSHSPQTTIQSSKETGESSQSLCEICADYKGNDQMFSVPNCTHKFCNDCISRHISITVKTRPFLNCDKAPALGCPGPDCKGVLAISTCRQIVSEEVAIMWDAAVCEAMIAPEHRFYCPYRDCSALLVKDDEKMGMREAECPFCRRLMCVACNVSWHSGLSCEEYGRLGEGERGRDDLKLHELAKEKKWQRCPNCKFFVEKNEGCLHMTCRCGFQFCYTCGVTWTTSHACPPRRP